MKRRDARFCMKTLHAVLEAYLDLSKAERRDFENHVRGYYDAGDDFDDSILFAAADFDLSDVL